MYLTGTAVLPLPRLKSYELTLLRPRCLCWAVLVSVSLTVAPMQKISFLQLYNIETFYPELLFLSGKTVSCRVLYLWEVCGALLGSVFVASTDRELLSSCDACTLDVWYSPLLLPCCAYEQRLISV